MNQALNILFPKSTRTTDLSNYQPIMDVKLEVPETECSAVKVQPLQVQGNLKNMISSAKGILKGEISPTDLCLAPGI